MANVNKQTSKIVEAYLIEAGSPSYKVIQGDGYQSIEQDLFASIEERKHVFGYLKERGLDPFKRGTKEPIAIANALKGVPFATVMQAAPFGRSMWD